MDTRHILECGSLNEIRTMLFERAERRNDAYWRLIEEALVAVFERGESVGRREAEQRFLAHAPEEALETPQ